MKIRRSVSSCGMSDEPGDVVLGEDEPVFEGLDDALRVDGVVAACPPRAAFPYFALTSKHTSFSW